MKKTILILASLLVINFVNAQNISGKKFSSSGSAGSDWIESVTSDESGNYYAMGRFGGVLTVDSAGTNKTIVSSQNAAAFIIKYDSNNVYQWAVTIDNSYRAYAFSAVKFKSGYLYVATSVTGSSKITSTNGSSASFSTNGSIAGVVLKMDLDGVYQFHNVIESSTGYVELSDIDVSGKGDIYVTGRYNGVATAMGQNSTSKTTSASVGSMDAIYMKFDSQGNSSWIKTAGGSSDDISNYVHIDSQDNLYMSHQFSGSATFGTSNISTTNQWGVVYTKIDTANGNILWLIAGQGPMSTAGSMVTDADGNLYLIGVFQGTKVLNSVTSGISKSITSNGGYDVFLAKYTKDGNIVWVKTFGSAGDEWPWRSVMRNNHIYFSFQYPGAFSFSSGSNSFSFGNAGMGDDAIISFDTSGVCKWLRTINGTGTERSWAIDFTSKGKIIVGGTFGGTINMGGVSLIASSSQNGYLYTIDTTLLSLSINNSVIYEIGNNVEIFPNPISAGDNLNIYLNNNENNWNELSIYDLNGKLYSIEKIQSNKEYYTINTSNLSKGTYFVKLTSAGIVHRKKLVVL